MILKGGYKRYLNNAWTTSTTYGIPNKMQVGTSQADVVFTDTELTNEVGGVDLTGTISVDLINLQATASFILGTAVGNTNTLDGFKVEDSSNNIHSINKTSDVNKTSSVILKVTKRERRES